MGGRELDTVRADVLVIGCGAAGARAAYEAKRHAPSREVVLIHTGGPGAHGSSGLTASESLGLNAPLDLAHDHDDPAAYLDDMLATGVGLADEKLCRVVAGESAERVRELMALGVRFDGDDSPRPKRLSGCTHARSLTVGGSTGKAMVAALLKGCRREGVRVLPGVRAARLITDDDGAVVGALGLHRRRSVAIQAQATVLATGGAGRLFSRNVNVASTSGDGWGMALRCGARLKNVEFFQIGPGLVWPPGKMIVHSSLWKLRPVLRNGRGEEFLGRYCPAGVSAAEVLDLKAMSFPFSVRTPAMYLDIAMHKELLAGRGTEHGGLYLDLTHVPEETFRRTLPWTYEAIKKMGVDLSRAPVEIAPLVQNFNGGVEIDEHGYVGVPGLWACGEVTGGVHGADRPGGNNLADTQVFGYRAGVAAARHAEQVGRPVSGCQRAADVMHLASAETRVLRRLAVAAYESLGVVRTASGLERLLEEIAAARVARRRLSPLADDRLTALEAIAVAALTRAESRGTHYREDYPQTDAALAHPSVVTRAIDSGRLSARCS